MCLELTTQQDSEQPGGRCQGESDRTPHPGRLHGAAALGSGLGVGEEGLPPSGHTGAVNTVSGEIDYLEVTFKTHSREAVLGLFTPAGCELSEWQPLPSGRNGYRQGAIRGQVRCYWDGSEVMGIHVVASGQGVDQLEAEGIIRAWEGPEGFAATLIGWEAEVSRIDIAFDDRVGYLTPARIEGAIREGRCVSRWKQADPRAKINLADGTAGGWSLYLGSRSSRICARFYDKQAEQAEKGNVTEGHWMRCEIEARDERGDALLRLIAAQGVASVRSVLLNYVDFKKAGETDSNRSRWATCDWWSEFLGEVGKLRLSTAQLVRTLEKSALWFKRQIAPTFALLMASARHGEGWLQEQFELGVARLKPWQWAALELSAGVT